MTRIDDLGAFIRQQEGVSESRSGAPLVFWDGYGLDNPYSGISRYALRLAEALKAESIKPILLASAGGCRWFDDVDRFSVDRALGPRVLRELKVVWPQIIGSVVGKALQSASGAGGRAILHGLSNFNVPVWPRKTPYRRVLTVHDIIPLLDPQAVSAAYYLQFRAVFGRALHLADGIVCVSEWTRQTILERYPDVESKIRVVRNGTSDGRPMASDNDLRVRRSERPQFLCVSRYETYKNLELLIDILEFLPKEWQGVLVTDAEGERALKTRASATRRREPLKILSGLSDGELRSLYQVSHVYIHPSWFEGFCLPAAEALMAGLPVVYRKDTAIEELVPAALGMALCEKDQGVDWAHAVEKMFAFRHSAEWLDTVRAHITMLPTWEDSAKSLKSLYNDLS